VKPYANLLILLFATLSLSGSLAFAQSSEPPLDCIINRVSQSSRSVGISCSIANLPSGKTTMLFPDEFAGVDRLSERIHFLKVTNAQSITLPLEIRGNGLFLFDLAPGAGSFNISYEMRLARAFDPSQHALVSSLGPDAAILMMADLLPHICTSGGDCAGMKRSARLRIEQPAGWQVATIEQRQGEAFNLVDPARAVFFLGRLRERTARIGEMSLRVSIAGDWFFREEEVFSIAEAIAREQNSLIDGKERGDFLVTLAPFPQPLTGLRSSGITIGRTVVLLLNPSNDANQSFKHYRRHLAHEMFHFYLPNAFRIRENFDWFWEGFTRYVALMTLARLRLIDTGEYLDAVNAEYEAYIFNPSRAQISLIAASPEKFSDAASYDLTYRKGMLVAVLYDLELRWQSRGKFNLADLIKRLYRNYALPSQEVGNLEVLQEMRALGNFAQLIRDDIEGIKQIDLSQRVKIYGLVLEQNVTAPGKWRLRPAAKLSNRQQELISQFADDRR